MTINHIVNNLIDLGVSEKRDGNYESALKCYNRAKELDEYNPNVYDALGKIYYILNQYDEAIKNFLIAATISSNHINFEILKLPISDFSNRIQLSETEGQIGSIMSNFGRHIGYSNIAYNKSNSTLNIHKEYLYLDSIDSNLIEYRGQIDPYYRRNNQISPNSKIIHNREFIPRIGMNIINNYSFEELGSDSNLYRASSYFYQKHFE